MQRNVLHTSETRDGRKAADWRLQDRLARIVRIEIRSEAFPAYLYPDRGLPAAAPGTVVFSPAPDLAQAREWFPGHTDLWDAVRQDYWPVLLSVAAKGSSR
jgi:hypothetical protein